MTKLTQRDKAELKMVEKWIQDDPCSWSEAKKRTIHRVFKTAMAAFAELEKAGKAEGPFMSAKEIGDLKMAYYESEQECGALLRKVKKLERVWTQ